MIIALWCHKKLVSLQRMPLQERGRHCIWGDRRECYTVNDCSAVVICWGWHSWGQYLGTWSRHCTSGEKSPIFGAWSRHSSTSISYHRVALWEHTRSDWTIHQQQCRRYMSPLVSGDHDVKIKTYCQFEKQKLKIRSLQFMFSHSYGKLHFAKSNSLFKSFLFIQVLSS